MANISEFLLKIKEAVYGEEVRGSIHDALDAMNKECINAEATAISSRDSAHHNAVKAEQEADRSEAWSVGNEKGEPVLPDSEQYRNNAKYWAEYAQRYAQGGIHWKGSINFSQIPEDDNLVGDMYSIKDKFTTDSRFEYGAGIFCPAGTNIIFREDGLWDLSPSTISGYSDVIYNTIDEAQQDINNIEQGQTVFVKQSRPDAYCNNLAPIENTLVASDDHDEGRLLIFNRQLFKATDDISEGDNLVEGTNIQKTTVDEALIRINTELNRLTATHTYKLDSTGWASNPDSTTSGVLPYVYTIATTDYSNDSTPVWDVVGASGIPTSASELTNIGRIQYAQFASTGITLYTTSAPAVNLTLRVRGN